MLLAQRWIQDLVLHAPTITATWSLYTISRLLKNFSENEITPNLAIFLTRIMLYLKLVI